MKVRFINGNPKEICLTLLPLKNTPPIKLLENILKMLQEAFGIIVRYSTFSGPMDISSRDEIITMSRRKK